MIGRRWSSLLKHIFYLPLGSSSCFAYFHHEISLFTTQRTISRRLLQPIQTGSDNESLSMFYYPRSMPLFARSLQTSLFILSVFISTIYDRVEPTYVPLLISKMILYRVQLNFRSLNFSGTKYIVRIVFQPLQNIEYHSTYYAILKNRTCSLYCLLFEWPFFEYIFS